MAMTGCQKCAGCGEWFPEWKMENIFTGRMQYWCKTCYEQGARKVDQNGFEKRMRVHDRELKKGNIKK